MKTKYRFHIKGNLRPDIVFPIAVAGIKLEFVLNEGKIVAIDIIEVTDLSSLPTFSQGSNGIHLLSMGATNPEKFKRSLKLAEGLLSAFGLQEIITDEVKIEWIPANDDEKKLLKIYDFTHKSGPKETNETLSFDLIARPFIAGFIEDTCEVALSFFRQGKNDMREGKYIEAYYDFYFVLETLFSSGKTKNIAIESEFQNSNELVSAINDIRDDPEILNGIEPSQRKDFAAKYLNEDTSVIIKNIVSKRGFLHHHNPKHPDAWTPDKQDSCHIDSIFLMYVTYKLAWIIIKKYTYDKVVLKSYSDQYVEHGYGPKDNA